MKVLLVNPPANVFQKPDFGELWNSVQHTFTTDNILVHALNHGILSIASYLSRNGHDVDILDLSYDPDRKQTDVTAFNRMHVCLKSKKYDVVGISSQSGYDYVEALECARIAKEVNPNNLCVIGGQHAGFLESIPLEECDSLDIVIKGEGEAVFLAICDGVHPSDIPGITYRSQNNLITNKGRIPPVDLSELKLNYALYPHYADFAPIVEESRGCPFCCSFCTNRQIYPKGIRTKSADQIYEELLTVLELWGEKAYAQMIIFSAAQFGYDIENTLRLAELITPLGITWTAEFRVDSPFADHLEVLYASGLRLIALGMESADSSILSLMNKTAEPGLYIQKCRDLLKKTSDYQDLVARLNLMFYIGESTDTVINTLRFLVDNRAYIDAVYVTPVYFNPGTLIMRKAADIQKKYGTKLHTGEYWKKRHLYFCDPSFDFGFGELIVFSSLLEKLFSSDYGWRVTEGTHFLLEDKI